MLQAGIWFVLKREFPTRAFGNDNMLVLGQLQKQPFLKVSLFSRRGFRVSSVMVHEILHSLHPSGRLSDRNLFASLTVEELTICGS